MAAVISAGCDFPGHPVRCIHPPTYSAINPASDDRNHGSSGVSVPRNYYSSLPFRLQRGARYVSLIWDVYHDLKGFIPVHSETCWFTM